MSRIANPGRYQPAVPADHVGLLENIKQRVRRAQVTEVANERAVEDGRLVQVGMVPGIGANGAGSNQPRATSPHDPSLEGAAQPCAYGSPFQGSRHFSHSTQGGAPGWNRSRRWRCVGGQP